jgi:hypothetical protein
MGPNPPMVARPRRSSADADGFADAESVRERDVRRTSPRAETPGVTPRNRAPAEGSRPGRPGTRQSLSARSSASTFPWLNAMIEPAAAKVNGYSVAMPCRRPAVTLCPVCGMSGHAMPPCQRHERARCLCHRHLNHPSSSAPRRGGVAGPGRGCAAPGSTDCVLGSDDALSRRSPTARS